MSNNPNQLPFSRFLPSLSAWLPLIYDTIVIVLTLAKCLQLGLVNTAADESEVDDNSGVTAKTDTSLGPDSPMKDSLHDDAELGVGAVSVLRTMPQVPKTKQRRSKPKTERKASHIVNTLVKDGLMYYRCVRVGL
jgi:hypothetical protein